MSLRRALARALDAPLEARVTQDLPRLRVAPRRLQEDRPSSRGLTSSPGSSSTGSCGASSRLPTRVPFELPQVDDLVALSVDANARVLARQLRVGDDDAAPIGATDADFAAGGERKREDAALAHHEEAHALLAAAHRVERDATRRLSLSGAAHSNHVLSGTGVLRKLAQLRSDARVRERDCARDECRGSALPGARRANPEDCDAA